MLLLKIILSRDWTKRATGKDRLNCKSHHMVKTPQSEWQQEACGGPDRHEKCFQGRCWWVRIKETDA